MTKDSLLLDQNDTVYLSVVAPVYNTDRTLDLARQTHEMHAVAVLFPELGISAYTNDDLFY